MDNQFYRQRMTDPRPTAEIVALLLTRDNETQEYNDEITVLHFRGTREVLDAALALCRSANPCEREVGIDILREQGESVHMLREAREYLAKPDAEQSAFSHENYTSFVAQVADLVGAAREYDDEAIAELMAMLEREQDPAVLRSIVMALGHYRQYPRVLDRLLAFVHHRDEEIRYVLTRSLAFNEPQAIAALITLSADDDVDVRDWATFGLAQMIDDAGNPVETPAIHAALIARIDDEDAITRHEAYCGLIARGDDCVIEPLSREKVSAKMGHALRDALAEAGTRFGDPRLLPNLHRLRQVVIRRYRKFDMSPEQIEAQLDDLRKAIANCQQAKASSPSGKATG
jgi:HEAT repeat protein